MIYRKSLIFSLLLTIQGHSEELLNSEIINQAIKATIEIRDEMNMVISTPTTIDENISNEPKQEEQEDEENSIPTATIESVLQIEQNLTAKVETVPEERNSSTLNKETFDMSKGSLEKGEAIYIKQLKNICETKESEVSEHYSQDEWEAFANEGKFENTIFEICPQIEPSYNKAWSEDLYQFYYQKARDSEEIPEC